jgi:hypothetical protein
MAPLDVAPAQDVSGYALHLLSVGHIRRFVQMAGRSLNTPSPKRSYALLGGGADGRSEHSSAVLVHADCTEADALLPASPALTVSVTMGLASDVIE